MTPLPLVSLLSAALLVLLGTALVLRSRGSNSGSGRSRHSGGPRISSRLAPAPDPRFAAHSRFAPNPGGHFAGAQSITAAQPFVAAPRLAPAPVDLLVAQPDLRVVSQPDLRVVVTAPSWSVPPAASVSVLAALTEGDKARPAFAPSNSGDAFPTRARALFLLGAHVLAVLSIFTLSLAATAIGHHISHVGGISVWQLATLCLFVGVVFAAVVAARVQHDIMGGGWQGGFSLGYISYISPQVARYVISPSGISAAARRLNSSPARVILVEYGLLIGAALIVFHRLVGG